jgi:hypothetical protein
VIRKISNHVPVPKQHTQQFSTRFENIPTKMGILKRQKIYSKQSKNNSYKSIEHHSLGTYFRRNLVQKTEEFGTPVLPTPPYFTQGRPTPNPETDAFGDPLLPTPSPAPEGMPTARPRTDAFGVPFLPTPLPATQGRPTPYHKTDEVGVPLLLTTRPAPEGTPKARPITDAHGETTLFPKTDSEGPPIIVTKYTVSTPTNPPTTSHDEVNQSPGSFVNTMTFIYIALGVAVFVLIMFVIAACVIREMKRRHRQIRSVEK